MATKKFTLKDFIEKKKPKKVKTEKPKLPKRGGLADSWFTSDTSDGSSAASGGIGESLLSEIFGGMSKGASPMTLNMRQAPIYGRKDAGMTTYPSAEEIPYEEEPEQKVNKVDQARQLFQALYNRPNETRANIINSFMKDVGVTNSTAISYYTRFLDEFGLGSKDGEENLGQGVQMGGGMGDQTGAGMGAGEDITTPTADEEPDLEEPLDANRAGIIRTVDNAHMIYKRQSEDGTYEELWIYNIHDTTNDELAIRRDILAGTDIPVKKTRSADGLQSYTIITMGNAQILKLSGLPN